jgi:hypothetical protein
MRDRRSCLKLEPRPQLQLSRRVARAVRGPHEERGIRLVAARVGEVHAVGDVEEVDERVEPPLGAEIESISGAQIRLEEAGAERAISLRLVVLDGEGVGAGARVGSCRERLGDRAVAVRIDVAVGQAERRAAEGARDPAEVQATGLRNQLTTRLCR